MTTPAGPLASTPSRTEALACDVVVVGSGAGGAVAAARLAEAGLDVVVLEEGDQVETAEMVGDPLAAFRRMYRGRGLTATVGIPRIPLPLGRTLGGTTVVNSGTCFRAPGFVLDTWAREFGLRGLGEGGLDPWYQRVEADLSVAPVPEEHLGGNSLVFRRGAERLGYAGGPIPRNAKDCRATGVCVFGCPRGAKQSMQVSYLPRARDAGARLLVRTRVDRLLREGDRVAGVEGTVLGRDGRPEAHGFSVRARTTVLAAGAVHTPLLLAASGLADAHTGRHLRIHPSARVVALFDEEVVGHRGVPQGYHVRQFEAEGIFLQGMFLPPGVESPSVPGVGGELESRMERYRHLGSFGCLVSDSGEGSVSLLPGGMPLLRYDLSPRDHAKLLRGIGLVAETFFAAGAREVYLPVHGHRVLEDPDGIRGLTDRPPPASALEPMAFHPMGTARMGNDPRASVVDELGRHHRLRDLLVVDASLFPGSTHTNPQMTIMAIALRASEALAERLGRKG